MSLGPDDVRRVAKLAQLQLRDDEVIALGAQLSRIVEYVEQLNDVDVQGVEPMVHAVPTPLRRRDDVAHEGVGRRGVEGSAGYEDGLVKVPKIVE